MPVTQETSAPYAPAKAILGIVDRYRNKGMPAPINGETLGRAGISDSLIPRTLQALMTLDLIDDDYNPTETLEGLRLAPESEFRDRLADWLRNAYSDALTFVDPGSEETNIRDAFRSYKPIGQQPRMVSLFTGLLSAAGLRDHEERKTQSSSPPKKKLVLRRPKKQAQQSNASARNNTGDIDPAIAGLLQSLPPSNEGWTREKRDQFLTTLGAILDYCIPIVEQKSRPESNQDADEWVEGETEE